ncbi:MAG: hypothetical protein Q4E59_05420 [Bacteroidales bacterium]|nr:hypothetical protein [Bacteroidales bacterium]
MFQPHHLLRTWFAVLLTLTVALLPHHHHGEEVCTALEACDIDGQMNDRHTGHSTDNDCDETDCQMQTMRTFLLSSSRPSDFTQPDWSPAALLPALSVLCFTPQELHPKAAPFSVVLPERHAATTSLRGPPALA